MLCLPQFSGVYSDMEGINIKKQVFVELCVNEQGEGKDGGVGQVRIS